MAQTIFITGASTGLGFATAKLFAAKGWKVIATMRDPSKDTELKAVPSVTTLPLDVLNPMQIKDTAAKALAMGPVDVLFNNAGYGLYGPLEGISDEQLQTQMNTNVLGVMRVTQAFIPSMRERRSGAIVTTTSVGGLVTFPFYSTYHATKWALEGWSESLGYELGQFGIRVRTVAPGGIATDFSGRSLVVAEHPAYAEGMGRVTSVFRDPARAALRSTADKIAEDVYFAATDTADRATYVAGEDAKALYAQRLTAGIDPFRQVVRQRFLGG